MKIKKKFGDKISIKWKDAYTDDGWKKPVEAMNIDEGCLCFTSGYYVGQKDGFVVVCHTKGLTVRDNIMGVVYIPEKWCLEIK